jgi:hypothetical protein
MTVVTVAIVVAGVVVAAALGVGRSFDVTAAVLLLLIGAVGWLAIAVARKSTAGSVQPALCERCGGLISPSSPFCKHCGAPAER